jgi:hypothetical protein
MVVWAHLSDASRRQGLAFLASASALFAVCFPHGALASLAGSDQYSAGVWLQQTADMRGGHGVAPVQFPAGEAWEPPAAAVTAEALPQWRPAGDELITCATAARDGGTSAGYPPPDRQRIPLYQMTIGFVIADLGAVAIFGHDKAWFDDGHRMTDALTQLPAYDDDVWHYNYVLHPLVGSEYFLAARNRGWSAGSAFWYSAMMSAFYEYGPENMIQQPSIQDLIVTPTFGSILGELRYDLKKRVKERGRAGRLSRIWFAFLDPLDITIGGYPDGVPKLIGCWRFPL